jgi:hypothetical protein
MGGWTLDDLHALTVSEYDTLHALVEEVTKKPAED